MPVEFRKKQFTKFQRGEFNILSATDAGCRGLDTVHVRDVINYDFPLMTAEYIHRYNNNFLTEKSVFCNSLGLLHVLSRNTENLL